MLASEMIERLSTLKEKLGDVEVLITDGFTGNFYSGKYSILEWNDPVKGDTIDIGLGGCEENSE